MATPQYGNQIINHSNVPRDLVGSYLDRVERSQVMDQRQRQLQQQQRRQRAQDTQKTIDAVGMETWAPFADQVNERASAYQRDFLAKLEEGYDPNELRVSPEFAQREQEIRNLARQGNSAEKVYKEVYETIETTDGLDKGAAKEYLHSLAYDRKLGDNTRDLASALDTPAFYDRGKLLEGTIKDIKDSFNEASTELRNEKGKLIAYKEENKLRFPVNEATGRIEADFVQHIVDQRPELAESLRFDLAKRAYEAQSGHAYDPTDATDVDGARKLYQDQYRDDDSEATKRYIYRQTEGMLQTHQRRENKNSISMSNDPFVDSSLRQREAAARDARKATKKDKEDLDARTRVDSLEKMVGGDPVQLAKLKDKKFRGGVISNVQVRQAGQQVKGKLDGNKPVFGRSEGKESIVITVDKQDPDDKSTFSEVVVIPIESEQDREKAIAEIGGVMNVSTGKGFISDERRQREIDRRGQEEATQAEGEPVDLGF